MNEWKVYCYTGKNGKKYIGITSFNLAQRAGKMERTIVAIRVVLLVMRYKNMALIFLFQKF